MFKKLFPNKILSLNNNLITTLLIIMILVIAAGLMFALFISPSDYIQGDSARIMYVHVPSSFIALGCFGFIGIGSILNLIFKIKFIPLMTKSLAPVGCIFSLVSIVTGSLWGKPTWGIWWVWDARLTSTLVLFFLYIGVIALRSAMERQAGAGRACAILALVGVVNLPVIKFSVEWWYTLHQPASFSLTEKPAMPVEMWLPLLIMVVAYYLFFFAIWIMRIRNEILLREKNTDWVKQWLAVR